MSLTSELTATMTDSEKLDLVLMNQERLETKVDSILEHIEMVKAGLAQAAQNPMLRNMFGGMFPGM